ncbi:hypothetical protein Tco_0593654 [Tanacetum coccineum]
MGGLKTCSATFWLVDGSTDPGMVDLSAFMVDPSPAKVVVGPTKHIYFVTFVDALLLSNPKPILQLGKLFTNVRLKWKPTGRLFTIVGNLCPLTRITPKKIVHLKETTSNSVKTSKPKIKVYSRRPKQIKSVGSSKKAKIVESKIANNSEPNHLWGSNATDVPSSSSLVNDRNDQVAKIMGYGDYQLGNNLEGVDLLSGSRDTDLYTISLDDMLKTSLACLLSKASKTKSCVGIKILLSAVEVIAAGYDFYTAGELTLSSLDVLQGFSFFLQMGFTLILATLDGLDVGLLGDVIGEDDCDDDG